MAEQKYFFVDTRKGAKSDKPFAITNPDAARSMRRNYNNGEGPFKPVDQDEAEFQINRIDLKEADMNTVENQVEAMQHNKKIVSGDDAESPFAAMDKDELKDELEARGIEYKKSGPESTNEFYRKQLEEDNEIDE